MNKIDQIIELHISQIKFDVKSLYELLEYSETVNDCHSEYSGGWQSVELSNLLIRARDALNRIEKFINNSDQIKK